MLCIVTESGVLDDGRQIYSPGDQLEIEDDEARRLVAAGKVKISAGIEDAVELDGIVDLIESLDPDDPSLWTKSGKPATEALTELLGIPVSADMRDAAWKICRARAEDK